MVEDGKEFVVVRVADLANQEEKQSEYNRKKEFLTRADVRSLLDDFTKRLSSFKYKTQVQRFLE